MDSPSPMDPNMAEQTFEQAIQAASRVIQNEQFAIRRFQSLPGRLLGHSPVLRNITNSQASGTWRKTEACDQAAHGSGEDKENVCFQKARVEALQGERGAYWSGFLAFDHASPCIAHRMDLSSRCQGNPHIPATPVLLGSGPAAEKPLPRGQAQLPT